MIKELINASFSTCKRKDQSQQEYNPLLTILLFAVFPAKITDKEVETN